MIVTITAAGLLLPNGKVVYLGPLQSVFGHRVCAYDRVVSGPRERQNRSLPSNHL